MYIHTYIDLNTGLLLKLEIAFKCQVCLCYRGKVVQMKCQLPGLVAFLVSRYSLTCECKHLDQS